MKYKCIVFVALFTGLRRSEIMGLKWENVDLENRVLSVRRIRQSLTGMGTIVKAPQNDHSIRSIALPEMVVNVLKEYKQMQNEE